MGRGGELGRFEVWAARKGGGLGWSAGAGVR